LLIPVAVDEVIPFTIYEVRFTIYEPVDGSGF